MDFRLIKQKELLALSSQLEKQFNFDEIYFECKFVNGHVCL